MGASGTADIVHCRHCPPLLATLHRTRGSPPSMPPHLACAPVRSCPAPLPRTTHACPPHNPLCPSHCIHGWMCSTGCQAMGIYLPRCVAAYILASPLYLFFAWRACPPVVVGRLAQSIRSRLQPFSRLTDPSIHASTARSLHVGMCDKRDASRSRQERYSMMVFLKCLRQFS